MGKIIKVPGHGDVEFPDSMSDDQIVAAIQKNLSPMPTGAPPATPPTAAAPPDQFAAPRAAVDWVHSRLGDAAAGALGTPRAMADLVSSGIEGAGLPKWMGTVANAINPVTLPGMITPTTDQIRGTLTQAGVPDVKTPGSGGKILDATTTAAMMAPLGGGSVLRNILPSAVAGAGSEIGGQVTAGTKYEPIARLLSGIIPGITAAGAQNVAGNIAKGVRNAISPNVDEATAKAIARALERDQTTGPQFMQAHAALGPDALAIEAGGPNMRGMVRGTIAPPGTPRSIAEDAFKSRLEQADATVPKLIDQYVSPLPPMSTRVATLDAERAAAAAPAYEASGVPRRIEMTETTVPGEPVKKMVPILPGARAKTEITVPGEPVIERSFNSPNFSTPAIERELKDNRHVRSAINAARSLPDFKYLPDNSMVMLDKAYKHLGGMEREAIRAGNGTRAFDIGNARRDFEKALTDANPKYGDALRAFSEPSKLIDAAELAPKLFKGAVHSEEVARQFTKLPQDQRVEFRGGMADYLRTRAGSRDTGTAAERVWSGGDNSRDRIASVLGSDYGHAAEYAPLANKMEALVNAGKTARDINAGSRTVPMGLEAADNANLVNAGVSGIMGRFGNAAGRIGGHLLDRIASGKTEAVNVAIAKALTSKDPATVGLVASLAEKQRLADIATAANRRATYKAGTLAPIVDGSLAAGLRRYNEQRAAQ